MQNVITLVSTDDIVFPDYQRNGFIIHTNKVREILVKYIVRVKLCLYQQIYSTVRIVNVFLKVFMGNIFKIIR